MKWSKVRDPSLRKQPSGTRWSKWKEQIAEDCGGRCVYCATPDSMVGTEMRYFTVDHFRPKKRFPKLRIKIENLYYCCAICNSYKGDDWQGDPLVLDHPAYVDPAIHDYNLHFRVIDSGAARGSASSSYVSCRYMIEKLYLNRPQLIVRRRIALFEDWAIRVEARISQLEGKVDADDLRTLLEAWRDMAKIRRSLNSHRFKNSDYR